MPFLPAVSPSRPDAPARDTGRIGFVRDLASHGQRVALVTGTSTLTYTDLADRVQAAAARLGDGRRLVLVAGANAVESLVHYLGALSAGHPVLLAPGGSQHLDTMVAAYDPDVVVRPDAGTGSWDVLERRPGSAHELHPDLAVLLSTSGSTGSPKLVRLSHENVQANAESIATYLDIRSSDLAATTLPLHYCYGLSVVHSHLLRGAGLLLTDLSVVDPCFWDLFRAHRATTFAAVPHTVDLLDRVGFDRMHLPHLRYLTQAGGRLAPDTVRRYAQLGRRRGWSLFVMYGQTEATARMAYLPPELAATAPGAIGIPVPGGAFTVEPLDEDSDPAGDAPWAGPGGRLADGVGELVYSGPNVMLGYAHGPADLALGRTISVLRTGDLARRTPRGLYEVVGRRSRFLKIFGLRIDLQAVESRLAQDGLRACCAGDDRHLVVALERGAGPGPEQVRRLVAEVCGLPAGAVEVHPVDQLPRLATGKPDYPAVLALGGDRAGADLGTRDGEPEAGQEGLRALFARVLERPDATEDDTFVSLGGDSLSYVEMAVRLQQALGHLPAGWHTTPIGQLRARPRRRWQGRRSLETSVALRAAAIVMIVGTHAGLFSLAGGAHVLLAVVGFNVARFHLGPAHRIQRVRHLGASVARIAVPSVVWIAAAGAVTGAYGWTNVLLLNAFVDPQRWGPQWHFWFVEAAVLLLLATAALISVPQVDRLERRHPFALPCALVALGLLTRYEIVQLVDRPTGGMAHVVFWLFALGWATARASTLEQRLLVTAAAVASVPGFYDNPQREAIIVAGLCLLVWAPSVPAPAALVRAAGVLASGSLYVYLTHWQVYPLLDERSPALAVLASFAVGLLYWALATRVARWVTARRSGRRAPAQSPSRPGHPVLRCGDGS